MCDVILHLNYVHVLVVTIAGFVLGCLWCHGPLFGKPWMAEMGLTKESMEAAMQGRAASYFLKGFGFTLLGTFGLAALVAAHGVPDWKHGAAFGAFVGIFGPVAWMLNSSIWEKHSMKLQLITASQEIAIYTLQGAILGAWR